MSPLPQSPRVDSTTLEEDSGVGASFDDAHLRDVGLPDAPASSADASAPDATVTEGDASPADGAVSEAGLIDASEADVGPLDGGLADIGPFDGGAADAGPLEAGLADVSALDAGSADTGVWGPPTDGGVGTCGDGVINAGEICDDGNRIDGDCCGNDCRRASCFVPVTHPTIQSGLNDPQCTTLCVYSGRYTENLTTTQRTTIQGVGTSSVVIDGGGRGRVMDISRGGGTLRRLTLTNGFAARGAGIYTGMWPSGSLTLERPTAFSPWPLRPRSVRATVERSTPRPPFDGSESVLTFFFVLLSRTTDGHT